jgi:hypothetical protein
VKIHIAGVGRYSAVGFHYFPVGPSTFEYAHHYFRIVELHFADIVTCIAKKAFQVDAQIDIFAENKRVVYKFIFSGNIKILETYRSVWKVAYKADIDIPEIDYGVEIVVEFGFCPFNYFVAQEPGQHNDTCCQKKNQAGEDECQ